MQYMQNMKSMKKEMHEYIKPMLHKAIFNDNLHRNGLVNQSNLVQLHLHC